MTRLRDEPGRLSLDAYAQTVEIRATYADVDSFQHLNNVAIAGFFEEGRATLNMSVFGVDQVVRPSAGTQLLFASVAIEYIAQANYPGTVSVGTGVSRVGRSSFTQAAGLFQDGRCVALCDAVTVFAIDGAASDLPADVRAALEQLQLRS